MPRRSVILLIYHDYELLDLFLLGKAIPVTGRGGP
jgi:hypothetical protein